MSKRLTESSRAWLGPALILTTSTFLSACMMEQPGDFTDPARSAFYDHYPIKVVNAPVKVGVAAHGGMLGPEQVNAVASFARTAEHDARSRIAIRYPSASGSKGRQAAADAATIMVNQGVSEGMIAVGSYPAGASSPLQLSYERKVAVTRECGNWSDNLGNSPLNNEYQNFGCAYQNNVAAMVANAEDFEHPRAESGIVAASRVNALKIWLGSATQVQTQDTTKTSVTDQSSTNSTSSTSGN
jgi:pilus assembly protein CpaD